MEDILLVAPYNKLAEMAKDLKKTLEIPFSVIEGNLGETRDKVNLGIKNGAKIILTRGGTAEYLRERMQVPVIEIPVTSFDILKAISNVSSKGFKKIAVITKDNIIFKTNYLDNIMDITLQFEACKQVKEISGKVKYLIENDRIEAVIGDVNATNEALKNGIYGKLLESGEESLVQALNEAKRVLEINTKERVRIKEVESILNIIGEGVVTVDKRNKVILYNKSAEKIFGLPKEQVIGNDINECLSSSELEDIFKKNKEEKDTLIQINNKKVVSNIVPITISSKIQGVVSIFEEISSIQKTELNIRKKLNKKGLIAKHTFSDIIGESKEITKVKTQAIKFAKSQETIIIYGETGTGKELFAQSIHNASKRKDGAFVSINCASLNENLLESELFGYEEGAFTGAIKSGRTGLFELAHNGTLFLDEIGEVSSSFQAKLLRVLQEKEIRRVGGNKVIPINVRIICATNRNLNEEVKNKKFREDLYYRLSVLELKLPPIRNRKEDIIPMAISFLKQACIKEDKCLSWKGIDTFNCLLTYDWNGNSRELRNFIERLVICDDENELTESFIKEMLDDKLKNSMINNEIEVDVSKNLKEMESEFINKLLKEYNHDKDRLCRELNISKTTLWRKLNFKNEK